MIGLARQKVPDAEFEVGDAVTYHYPPGMDVVFAFASLLHLNQDQVRIVLTNVANSMNEGGIFYISLKYSPEYKEEVKEDQYGRRLFYFYNPEAIESLVGKHYETVHLQQQVKGNTEWFEIALKKVTRNPFKKNP